MHESNNNTLILDLRQHLEICRSLAAVVEREHQALRQTGGEPATESAPRKNLLPSLSQSLYRLRQHRVNWCNRPPHERARDVAVPALLREIQDLIMKVIVLDRENEQALLRKGLVPARHLPHANRQRPQHVADLYRQQKDATSVEFPVLSS
jgi:hypothetical protein